MEEEYATEPCSLALKLPPLHNIPSSPEHTSSSGTATPPLQTTASVPFKWEEQPGKPRPGNRPEPEPEPAKCLDLPPCRVATPLSVRFTKTPSPTSVLDGPHNVGRPKFSSFRFFREGRDFVDGFSPALDGPVGCSKRRGSGGLKGRGFFGKFKGGKKDNGDGDGGSLGFSPSSSNTTYSSSSCSTEDSDESMNKNMRRKGSFSSVSHAAATKSSHIWASIYGGLKQVIQWKSGRKPSKEGQH